MPQNFRLKYMRSTILGSYGLDFIVAIGKENNPNYLYWVSY